MKVFSVIIISVFMTCQCAAQSAAYDRIGQSFSATVASKIYGEEIPELEFKNEITAGGFQEFKNINVISLPEIDSDLDENYFIYPHLVLNNLVLNFEKMKAGIYILEVYDISAKLLINTKLKLKKHPLVVKISFLECANGVYLIKIRNTVNLIEKAFRVVK